MDELFEKRKKIIYEFICDEFYVPMKLKELSMLLQVPKDQKGELKAVMDSLEKEGRVQSHRKENTSKVRQSSCGECSRQMREASALSLWKVRAKISLSQKMI